MNKIAVAVSIYKTNSTDQIVAMLDSVANQTQPCDLFVKVDGMVPNELGELLQKEYEEGHTSYLDFRDENRGIPLSYNELFQEILERGYDYIARMDADDIMVPNRIELQYQFMQRNPDIDIVGGFIEEFGDGFAYRKTVRYPLKHDGMFALFSKRVPVANVTTFFRRSFFEKAGFYPTTSPTNEDTLLWMKGFETGCRFANISEVLVKVRVGQGFFGRRGGISKAWNDFYDRLWVIKTLGYNKSSYFYAVAVFLVNISPAWLKKILYKRLR